MADIDGNHTPHGPEVNRETLEGLIGAIEEVPTRGQSQWKAETEWHGGFRSEAKIRNFTFKMDEPEALGGSDTAPNMVEAVLGAYGCCLTTGYAMNALRRNIKLEDIRISLEGDLDLRGFLGLADPQEVSPGYSGIRVDVTLVPAPGTDAQALRALHDDVLRTSPVGAIIGRPVDVTHVLKVAEAPVPA
ncbi:MAG: OsmC family protein [Myxococcota bacterium]